jgi:hypothetical protein
MQTQLHVAIDVGSQQHWVAIGWEEGEPIEEFDYAHTPAGMSDFFNRIRKHEEPHHAQVCRHGRVWRLRPTAGQSDTGARMTAVCHQ